MLPGKVKEWLYRKVRAVAEKGIFTGYKIEPLILPGNYIYRERT